MPIFITIDLVKKLFQFYKIPCSPLFSPPFSASHSPIARWYTWCGSTRSVGWSQEYFSISMYSRSIRRSSIWSSIIWYISHRVFSDSDSSDGWWHRSLAISGICTTSPMWCLLSHISSSLFSMGHSSRCISLRYCSDSGMEHSGMRSTPKNSKISPIRIGIFTRLRYQQGRTSSQSWCHFLWR